MDDELVMHVGADLRQPAGGRRGQEWTEVGDHPCDAGPRQIPEVVTMPRTVDEILAHADELARHFEEFEPDSKTPVLVTELGQLYEAVQARAQAERLVAERVQTARAAGTSWSGIGQILGTSGEAARQRYGSTSSRAVAAKKAAATRQATAHARIPRADPARKASP
jgi:hypothetical protein